MGESDLKLQDARCFPASENRQQCHVWLMTCQWKMAEWFASGPESVSPWRQCIPPLPGCFWHSCWCAWSGPDPAKYLRTTETRPPWHYARPKSVVRDKHALAVKWVWMWKDILPAKHFSKQRNLTPDVMWWMSPHESGSAVSLHLMARHLRIPMQFIHWSTSLEEFITSYAASYKSLLLYKSLKLFFFFLHILPNTCKHTSYF